MGRSNKGFAFMLVLIFLMTSCMTTVKSASTIPQPTAIEPTAVPTPTPPKAVVTTSYWRAPFNSLEILSPKNHQILNDSYVILSVNVSSVQWFINSVYVTADWFEGSLKIFGIGQSGVYMDVNFTEIPDGDHTVTAYLSLHDGSHYSKQVSFVTNAYPPKIVLLSPLNQIYNISSFPLLFTVDESVDWIGYSFDGKENLTTSGNTTIANITNGLHSITVYANDTFGNFGSSQTANFKVALPTVTKPLQTVTILLTVSVAVVALSIGLLLYRRHRKTAKLSE